MKKLQSKNSNMSGSCRIFPSHGILSALRACELRGIPSKSVTRSCYALLGFLLSTVVVNSVSALTYSNNTDVTFTFNPTISLSVSGDLVIDNLSPNNSADSNTITVTASSNAPVGYTLYTNVGDSSNNYTDLRMSSSDSTNVFGVLPSAVASLANMGDSKWGYSYCNNSNDCTSSSNWVQGSVGSTTAGYGKMPLYNDASHNGDVKLADTNNSNATTINFKIGAKASGSQAAGTYTNVINFINVPKVITTNYTLSYADNSGTTTTGTLPANTTGTTTDGTFTISTTRPTNTNADYVFRGWCTVDNSSDVTACPSNGSIIFPGDLYVINSTNASWSSTVYAVWQSNYVPFCDTHTCMQDVNSASLATLLPNVGDTTTLYDKRDETPYIVGKLADNNYWMLENLSLDLVAVSLDDLKGTAGSPNTNASDTTLGHLKNGGGSSPYTGTAVAYAGSSNAYDTPQVAVSGNCNNVYCVNDPESGKWISDSVTQETINGKTSIAQGKIGAYYNYCAASAGSYCYASGSGTGNATEDICPAGWRLPTGNSSGEFNALYSQYSSGSPSQIAAFQTALHTPLSGRFYSGKAYYQGYYGYFWSSTFGNGDSMYRLNVDSSFVNPFGSDRRDYSYSVRCILSSSQISDNF